MLLNHVVPDLARPTIKNTGISPPEKLRELPANLQPLLANLRKTSRNLSPLPAIFVPR